MIGIQRPELTDDYQLRVFVCEDRPLLEDYLNGMLTGALVFYPLLVLLPEVLA